MDHPSSHPISVIVPHYNDLAGLDRCLASLASQTLSRSDYEVIVVDNMSSLDRHELERVVSSRGRLLFENDQGAGPTRNRGVAGSSGKFLAFIDSDCVADRLWLERGIAALKDFDFVGGRVDVLVTDPAAPTPVESFEQVFAFDFERYIRVKGFTGTGNLFCRRALFDSVGPFQNGVSEDMEWSHRATALGFSLGYCDTAIVGHPARTTWSDLRKKWHRLNRETYGLMRRRRYASLRWILRNWLMPASIIPHAIKILRTRRLRGARSRIGAIAILARIRMWRFVDAHRVLLERGNS